LTKLFHEETPIGLSDDFYQDVYSGAKQIIENHDRFIDPYIYPLEQDAIDDNIADTFRCILTVETPNSMQGEYWITVEAQDGDGNLGTMVENEYWFLNPEIALAIDGDLAFENVRPGSYSYSETLLVGNDAEAGSGVMLDMFITGTDFYDSSSSGARCPDTNQLSLDAFRYFVTNGAYSSFDDLNNDFVDADRNTDVEGYTNIEYGIGFNDPDPFYDNAEILTFRFPQIFTT